MTNANNSRCNPCGDCECSECCDDRREDKREDSALLKFSGILAVTDDSPAQITWYLGDAGPVIITSGIPVSYPAARRSRLKNLAVNITYGLGAPVVLPATTSVTVQLFRNGIAVPGFVVVWGTGELLGVKKIKTDRLRLARGDFFDLRVSLANGALLGATTTLVVTATIGDGEE
jgi:hypothetical protein